MTDEDLDGDATGQESSSRFADAVSLTLMLVVIGTMIVLLFVGLTQTDNILAEFAVFTRAVLFTLPTGVLILLLVLLLTRNNTLLRGIAWLSARLPGTRRRRLAGRLGDATPFPHAWEKMIRRNVRLYRRLPLAEQTRLQQLIIAFLEGKQWVGCKGLEISDEIRVTIAAQACILLLGSLDHDEFASVESILVYPTAFASRHDDDLGMQGGVATLGEAWYRGPVILAWDEVLQGGRYPDDGRNVVYHEFAHQLDFAGESLEQAISPEMEQRRLRRDQVLQEEYQALVQAAEEHRPTLLDTYGATDTREFFAVSTECFFERPIDLEEQHPNLYEVLRDFYGQDPAERHRRYLSLAKSAARRDREAGFPGNEPE